ncbi:MAG: methyltransferase domain-containing protein [Pseudomonadota bacterium]
MIFAKLSARRRFQRIYKYNYWSSSESLSGAGSTLKNTQKLRADLHEILDRFEVASIVDIACGDFNWFRDFLKNKEINYTGLDIVPEVIEVNKREYEGHGVRFHEFNILEEVPPKGDMVIFRDCILHLSFKDGIRALRNISQSGSALIMISSYPDADNIADIVTGRWRVCDLRKHPFNLPEPIQCIEEDEAGKFLCLWRLEDISNV